MNFWCNYSLDDIPMVLFYKIEVYSVNNVNDIKVVELLTEVRVKLTFSGPTKMHYVNSHMYTRN